MSRNYSDDDEAERYRRFRDASLGFGVLALAAWLVLVWSFADSSATYCDGCSAPSAFTPLNAAALGVAVTATVVSATCAVLAGVQRWGNEHMRVLRQLAARTATDTTAQD